MKKTSDSLFAELNRLETVFAALSERLTKAAEQFRQVGVSPAEDLVADLSDYEKGFTVLASKIVDYGREVSLPSEQLAKLVASTLDDLRNSIRLIAEFEEQCRRGASKNAALATLDLALGVVRRDRANFPPLLSCQAKIRALREEILNYPGSELHPAVQEISERKQPVARLLSLIEDQSGLTDDECLSFYETIAQSFGRELAIAATRGKLEVQPARAPVPFAGQGSTQKETLKPFGKQISQAPSSSITLPVALVTTPVPSAGQSPQGGMSSSPSASVQGDVEGEIDAILTSISGWGVKNSQSASLEAGAPVTAAPPLTWRRAGTSGPTTPGSIPDASAVPPGQGKPPLSAGEVVAHVVEAVELERVAALLYAQGKDSEAEDLYQQLLTLQKAVLAPQDPRITETLGNLAAIRRNRERAAAPAALSSPPVQIKVEKLRATPPKPLSGVAAPPIQVPPEAMAAKSFRSRVVLWGIVALVIAALGYATFGRPLVHADFLSRKHVSPAESAAAPAAPEIAATHQDIAPAPQKQPETAPVEQAPANPPDSPLKAAPESTPHPNEASTQKVASRQAATRHAAPEEASVPPRPIEPPKEAAAAARHADEIPQQEAAARPEESPKPVASTQPAQPQPPATPNTAQQPPTPPQPLAAPRQAEIRKVEPEPSRLSGSLDLSKNTTTIAENARGGLANSAVPPSIPAPSTQGPLRIAGPSAAAKLVRQTQPVYPSEALRNRVEGTVHLEVLIAKDGSVEKLTVVNGQPLLSQAAVDAIRQWRYQPTMLNGAPVEVLTNVDVTFKMAKQ